MTITTPAARLIVLDVYGDATGSAAPIEAREMQAVLAIFRGETGYGTGWKGAMVDGNNWGANQCPHTGADCSPEAQAGKKCRLYSDTRDGTDATRFAQCFEVFDTPQAGAGRALRGLYVERPSVPPTLKEGDAMTIARTMQRAHYFSQQLPAFEYAQMIWTNAQAVAAKLDEPLLLTFDGATPPATAPTAPAPWQTPPPAPPPATNDGAGALAAIPLGVWFLLGRTAIKAARAAA